MRKVFARFSSKSSKTEAHNETHNEQQEQHQYSHEQHEESNQPTKLQQPREEEHDFIYIPKDYERSNNYNNNNTGDATITTSLPTYATTTDVQSQYGSVVASTQPSDMNSFLINYYLWALLDMRSAYYNSKGLPIPPLNNNSYTIQNSSSKSGTNNKTASAAFYDADDPYCQIDAYAINVPPEYENSLQSLADYLTTMCIANMTPSQKVRALFRWITHNIMYDVPAFISCNLHSAAREPEDVLKSRSAVCEGYARLFAALAVCAGFPTSDVHVITGVAKVLGGIRIGVEPHAWNAIKIDDKWYLVDCTWGAGGIENGKFIQRFTPNGNFFPDSRSFAYSHFPDDIKWQLLDKDAPSDPLIPRTRQQFERLPNVSYTYFAHSLQLKSHPNTNRIQHRTPNQPLVVTLQAPSGVSLMAQLKACNQTGGQILLSNRSFIQQKNGDDMSDNCCEFEVYASFPPANQYGKVTYVLFVLVQRSQQQRHSYDDANDNGNGNIFDYAVEYIIDPPAAPSPTVLFPTQFVDFYRNPGTRLYSPTNYVLFDSMSGSSASDSSKSKLATQGKQVFKLRVPNALRVGVLRSADNSWTFLREIEDFLFEGAVDVTAKGEYSVGVLFNNKSKRKQKHKIHNDEEDDAAATTTTASSNNGDGWAGWDSEDDDDAEENGDGAVGHPYPSSQHQEEQRQQQLRIILKYISQ